MRKLTVIVVLAAIVLGGLTGLASAEGQRDQRRGYRRVTVIHGKLTEAAADHVTVQKRNGRTVTKAVNADTKVKGAESADQLQTGKPVVVVSVGDTAKRILQRGGRRDL